MKREICCAKCAEEWGRIALGGGGPGKYPGVNAEGEGMRRLYGEAIIDCVCDGCGTELDRGSRVAAVSLYTEDRPYFEWESEFMQVCHTDQDPTTGHCSTAGCGNSAPAQDDRDPLDDPGYQEFIAETAKTCRARDKPCPGCCAGGICDGFLGGGRFEDDEQDNGYAEYDYDED